MSADTIETDAAPIAVENLTVRYGRVAAVDGVSFRVPRGAVYALLGRNGAGKSSIVRCLLGLRRPDRGRALLLGHEAWTGRARAMQRVGVVPEDPDAPPAMTVDRIAAFCARLYATWDHDGVAKRLERYAIPRTLPFGRLSKGQKGLVALALALGHRPEALVLDDPTLGLDVAARRALFEELIGDLADRATTVLLTTHDLAGVEGIADHVGILKEGRLVVNATMDALKQAHAATSSALEEIFLAETAAPVGGAR